MDRKGEKMGWIGGWIGTFLWLSVLSLVWIFQGRKVLGICGLVLFTGAIASVIVCAPWKHPSVKYWKLMLPPLVLLFACVIFIVRVFGGLMPLGMNWVCFVWMVPLFIPFFTMGNRTWGEGA